VAGYPSECNPSCDEIENKNRHFVTDIVILAWQTMAQELLFHRHRLHRSSGCTTRKTVPSPLRTPRPPV
jgi:hypothetical protein